MRQCPQCNFANKDVAPYCERCGTFLEEAVQQNTSYEPYTLPAQYNLPHSIHPTPTPISVPQYQTPLQPRSQITVFGVFRAIFYFVIATPIAAIGLIGTFTSADKSSSG